MIPVAIEGFTTNYATEAIRNDIYDAFFGDESDTYWESVASYYNISSYGQLSIEGIVTNWTNPYSVSELSEDIYAVIDDTVSFLSGEGIDTTEYDADENGLIDLVWYVYGAPTYAKSTRVTDNFWAYTSSTGDAYGSLTSPEVNNYCWGSTDFMYEGEGSEIGNVDAHTYIHETGHALGLDDYYTSDKDAPDPVGYVDMMSYNIIDHNAFTKIALGWTTPYVVTGDAEITISPFEDNGDCIVVGYDWDGNAFSEYLIIELYTPTGLNELDSTTPYSYDQIAPNSYGIVIYHVDARLCYDPYLSTGYALLDNYSSFNDLSGSLICLAHSNSTVYSPYDGRDIEESKIKLITLIDKSGVSHLTTDYSMNNNSLFQTGDVFTFDAYSNQFQSSTGFNNGKEINYTITFDSVTASGATISFTEIN